MYRINISIDPTNQLTLEETVLYHDSNFYI